MRKILRFLAWTRKHGFINLSYRIMNNRMFDTHLLEDFPVKNSSITDSAELASYPSLCGSAARETEIFKRFRSSRIMVEALDHVSIDQGKDYISEILKNRSWLEDFTKVLLHIDSLGKPRKYRFAPYGTFSPTLLRYLKVYVEIESQFGSLTDLDVVEIGIGFGGQSSLIGMLDKPASYTFYDIPPVLELTQRFVSELNIPGEFKYIDGRNPIELNADLVISNYAFSELSLDLQNEYLSKVILKSPRGYITWNSLSAEQLGGRSLADLVRLIPNSQLLPEQPWTSKNNAIIIWGSKK